jgi:hypothetical protein
MTRLEILEAFNVHNGLITTPGKFEGEPIYAPYFYAFGHDECEVLSHADDTAGEFAALIRPFATDHTEFPELHENQKAPAYILLTESSTGFVHVESVATEADADHIRAVYDALITSEESEMPETPKSESYTVGDLIDGMKRTIKHIISDRDRAALSQFDDSTWIQLGVGAMMGSLHSSEQSTTTQATVNVTVVITDTAQPCGRMFRGEAEMPEDLPAENLGEILAQVIHEAWSAGLDPVSPNANISVHCRQTRS